MVTRVTGPAAALPGSLRDLPWVNSQSPPQSRSSGPQRHGRAADFLSDSSKSGSPAWAPVSLRVNGKSPAPGPSWSTHPGAEARRGGVVACPEQEAERPPGRSVEGLEGLALQCGLDPADPALASSSADVREAGARAPLWAGAEVTGQPSFI